LFHDRQAETICDAIRSGNNAAQSDLVDVAHVIRVYRVPLTPATETVR
jgi:hypothetical protein